MHPPHPALDLFRPGSLRHGPVPGHHLGTSTTAQPSTSPAIPTPALLATIARTAGIFAGNTEPAELFDGLLSDLLALTGSEYGYLGEVLEDDDGAPYLMTWAITDIAWDDASRALLAQGREDGGLEFRNLETLFGWGLRDGGRVVISNDTAGDDRAGGRPVGHPPLDAYLGLPVHHGSVLVGQVGLANRPGGYDEALVEELAPLLATIGALVDAYRTHRQHREVETVARRRTAELTALVSVLRDAVLLVDGDLRVAFVNQHFCDLWGYADPEAFIGEQTEMTAWLLADQATRAGLPTPLPMRQVEDPHAFGDGIALAYLEGVPQLGTRVPLRDGRVLERDYLPIEHAPGFSGLLWIYRDVTEPVRRAEAREARLDQEREQRRLTEEQNRSLRELDRLKTEFVATVSHELRTPLTAIVNYAELLTGELAGGGPEAGEFAAVIDRNAQRLLGLVDDLLLVAHLESGSLQVEPTPVVVASLVTEALASHRPAIEAKGLLLDVDLPVDPTPLVVDRARFTQVIDNLIDNAVKFTPEGGRVQVAAQRRDAAWSIVVADTGIGVPEAEVDRLGERFYRASNARLAEISGTGLGLAVVAAIVDLHGGDLRVDTGAEGTTIEVTIPDPDGGRVSAPGDG